MEEQYYDNTSIAASAKREQLMKEAEEFRLRRHIAAMKKPEKAEKGVIPEKRRGYVLLPHGAHRSATTN